MNLFPDDHRSVYSMGRTVSRLRDFDDFSMDSPYSGRRPSSHTAYIPQPGSPGSIESSPRRLMLGEHHLPNFHHDHLHHQEHDQLGINTLQPNTQRRDRAREALLRRNLCDFNISVESGATNSISSRTGTAEVKTDQTVVQNFSGRVGTNRDSRSNLSLHSNQSGRSEDPNSADNFSSEDNLSHESYDLLDKEEEAQINTYSDNLKTVLSRSDISFDNSILYSLPVSMPLAANRVQNLDGNFLLDNDACLSIRDEVNCNVSGKNKITNHSSDQSDRLSINSSGMSSSPIPDSTHIQEKMSSLVRRRSSGSGSQKSKSSKENKGGNGSRCSSRLSQKECLPEDNGFQGHEVHLEDTAALNSEGQYIQRSKTKPESNRNCGKLRDDTRDSGMHESLIFQSPTNFKFFSSNISSQQFNSRTLPGKKRREKSPIIFTRGKLSVECSSNSSSSNASPRICRPKSLEFSVVALHDLPHKSAYSYRDDTIDQHDFEDSSSALSVQNELNYASSSDVPPTPDNSELPETGKGRHKFHQKKTYGKNSLEKERIYDIPEGIDRGDVPLSTSPASESIGSKTVSPRYFMDQTKFKSYLEISGKLSSEDSEPLSNRHVLKGIPTTRILSKVSSTESESLPSNNSVPAAVQFDSDTLSLPLDLLSPPIESESSTALVDSESLPAPPQFGSNRDDTDIEDEVTPKIDDFTPDSLDICIDTNTIKKKKNACSRSVEIETKSISQESTYESNAEVILVSQSTIDSFKEEMQPTLEILNTDKLEEPKFNNCRRKGPLLMALDTFDSFNFEHEFPVTRRQESTYEDRAEAMLEKQTTIDSFTSQSSIDDNVFMDPMFAIHDSTIGTSRDTVLESQSTFESFTTECEVLVTKREESTYEERAEALLESQNTIDSFTTEFPNEEVENDFNNELVYATENSSILIQNSSASGPTDVLIANMYVRNIGSNESFSTNGESEIDTVPFMDEGFDLADLNECTCNEDMCYRSIIPPPYQEDEQSVIQLRDTGFDCPRSPDLGDQPFTPAQDISNSTQDFIEEQYDMIEPSTLFPQDDFGTYVLQKPIGFRDGFLGTFQQRTLSRISEKSSNESGSPQSDGIAVLGGENTSLSDQDEPNYTTSEDNENAPSISSDLPENAANHLEMHTNPSLNNFQIEYNNLLSPLSSNGESPKITEFTQIEQDTQEEDLDDTNADEIKTEERISPLEIPPDLTNSISSENKSSNKDSEGSLHDSMELLEDINTTGHFHDHKDYHNELIDSENEEDYRRSELFDSVKLHDTMLEISDHSGRYVVKDGSEELMF